MAKPNARTLELSSELFERSDVERSWPVQTGLGTLLAQGAPYDRDESDPVGTSAANWVRGRIVVPPLSSTAAARQSVASLASDQLARGVRSSGCARARGLRERPVGLSVDLKEQHPRVEGPRDE
jgi:hypothetical protein